VLFSSISVTVGVAGNAKERVDWASIREQLHSETLYSNFRSSPSRKRGMSFRRFWRKIQKTTKQAGLTIRFDICVVRRRGYDEAKG